MEVNFVSINYDYMQFLNKFCIFLFKVYVGVCYLKTLLISIKKKRSMPNKKRERKNLKVLEGG